MKDMEKRTLFSSLKTRNALFICYGILWMGFERAFPLPNHFRWPLDEEVIAV